MKKIINKNMQQQLAQALFGTIAVKIPLNKAGTFAAPIRATAKVMESLLKFANKRSFNLFVFASAVVLNAGVVSEAFSCTVGSDGTLNCGNETFSGNNWTCDTATATCASSNDGREVTYDPTTGKKTSVMRTSIEGIIFAYTYDPNSGIMTSEAITDANGYTKTTTWNEKGVNNSNVTSRTLTDRNGQPVNGTVTSGEYTYTAENGVWTSETYTDSNGSSRAYTYDQTTGKTTSETLTRSDGSGIAYTYDPNTGKGTSETYTNSDGSSNARTFDPNTGKRTSETQTNSDGSGYARTYDPNTGGETSYAYTDTNGYTQTTTYDGNGTSASNITGRTLTDSNGQPVNGTVTSGIYTYTAENGVLTSETKTYSDGSGEAYTYDQNTGIMTSITRTGSDGSGYAQTYDPNTGKQTSYAYTYSDGLVYEITYDPNTGRLTSETYYDAEGNLLDGIFEMNGQYMIAEKGKAVARITDNASCNSTSDGLSYCISSDIDSGKCAAIIKNSSGRVVGTQVCKSGEYCYHGNGASASDCTTQFYSSDGKVIATYGEDGQAKNAYDYDGDGNKLVYNDQCAFVGKLDADGNSIYDVEDGLSSENRRTRYTPAEAAEIIGNSDDNMIVMYFK